MASESVPTDAAARQMVHQLTRLGCDRRQLMQPSIAVHVVVAGIPPEHTPDTEADKETGQEQDGEAEYTEDDRDNTDTSSSHWRADYWPTGT